MHRPMTDGAILHELRRCVNRNRAGGLQPEGILLEPWWNRRLEYLRNAGRADLIGGEGLEELQARARTLANRHGVHWQAAFGQDAAAA